MGKFVSRLQLAAPTADIRKPVPLPDFATYGGGAEDVVRSILVAALRDAVKDLPDSQSLVAPQIAMRIHRWRGEIDVILGSLRARAQPLLAKLTDEETELPNKVLAGFLEDDESLAAGVGLRLRSDLALRLPNLSFPFGPLLR